MPTGDRALNDPDDLAGFLASVESRAFRMAEIATGDREEALDLVQDAMMRLATRYADRGADQWGALFHRILQRRIADWYRRRKVRERWMFWRRGDDAEALMDNAPGAPRDRPDAVLADREALGAIESALRNLPLRQQQTFLLRAWEGLDTAATAAAMGCSEGTVKTHYSRALNALRDRLAEHEP